MPSSAFSPTTPKLQLVWDSTSLTSLQACPRRYQYEMLENYRGTGSVDLQFGGFFASAVERYKKDRVRGFSKADAQLNAVQWVTEATINDDGTFWGGHYQTMWHCCGTTKYKNAKGHAAKCPYAHKGAWFDGDRPSICGECGSPTEDRRLWLPVHRSKDRHGLIRAVAWWTEEQPEDLAAGLSPLMSPDGTPAVELSFKMPLPFTAYTGEPFILAGHMDDVSAFGLNNFVVDNKTTTHYLNDDYWAQYTVHTQVDTYDLVGSTLFANWAIQGVIIDAAQMMANGARFGRRPFYRTDDQREEHLETIGYWLERAQDYVRNDFWPMNKASCYPCTFKGACSKPRAERQRWLDANFEKRVWNPAEER